MLKFVVATVTAKGLKYYNGRTGSWEDILTYNKAEAFSYDVADTAWRRADLLTKGQQIAHGDNGYKFHAVEIEFRV
jgi:hypothetical protein